MSNVTRFRGPGLTWMSQLSRGERGPHPTVSNALICLQHDPILSGVLAYDEFSHQIMVTRAPPIACEGAVAADGPYPRMCSGDDVTLMQSYLQLALDLRLSEAVMQQACNTAAQQKRIHPVRDWLNGLVWDGKPRLAKWLHWTFGTPNDTYHATIGTKFLVAGVRRIRHPGCKFDVMLVLGGKQDLGKSMCCRALAGPDWFSDDMPHDLRNRDAAIALQGVWLMELAELASLVASGDETIKAFLSRQVDRFRPVHGRYFVERPRQTLLIGTTNQDDFLRDGTGNRRYWPVWCQKTEPAWIEENRDQLWAEAAHLEAEGATTWLDDETIKATATAKQTQHTAQDMWVDRVRGFIAPRHSVTTSEICQMLNLPPDKQNRASEMRVATVLRAEGWVPTVGWAGGKTVRKWVPANGEQGQLGLNP
jgi:predicted P-loop ATPase